MNFTVEKTSFTDALLIIPRVFLDPRGFFMEIYQEAAFMEIGIADHFVQDNHSHSARNVLRGMHFQSPPHETVKLVRCISGEIFDVLVDLRPNSPTFKKWEGFVLSGENKKMLYVPVGFAHGFYVTGEAADVVYKVTDYYYKECDAGFRWNDPEIGIRWPGMQPIISEKDSNLPLFKEIL
ncbi:MAG: dTDP-4-dehydrorhamnose 3,5-epimerase [Patescibacteria group bacterium]|nr:dTDP-4-dehydrorhamnose 3,5-epimerase [Patescibacteria group bacterium]